MIGNSELADPISDVFRTNCLPLADAHCRDTGVTNSDQLKVESLVNISCSGHSFCLSIQTQKVQENCKRILHSHFGGSHSRLTNGVLLRLSAAHPAEMTSLHDFRPHLADVLFPQPRNEHRFDQRRSSLCLINIFFLGSGELLFFSYGVPQ